MKVANKLNTAAQNNVFSSMMLQLHSQTAQQALMQKELQNIKYKLEQTSKTLAQKDMIIGSLEDDIDHMISLLSKSQHSMQSRQVNNQWINRSVPGLNHDTNLQATA